MKKLSFWAKANPKTARLIIIFSWIAINIIGITLGKKLSDIDIYTGSNFIIISVIIYLIARIAYPTKKNNKTFVNRSNYYVWQKSCDIILSFSTFMMLIYIGNQLIGKNTTENTKFNFTTANGAIPRDSLKNSSDYHKKITALSSTIENKNLTWKEKRKELRKELKAVGKKNGKIDAEAAGLIFLLVLLGAALLLVVAFFACGISCSGDEGGAMMLLIFGGTGVIVGIGLLIRNVLRKRKKKS